MWKITKDLITSEDELKEGKTWVGKQSANWNDKKVENKEIHEFRLLDGDEIPYLEGVTTDCNSFAPLDHFEDMLGVVVMELKNKTTGEWDMM